MGQFGGAMGIERGELDSEEEYDNEDLERGEYDEFDNEEV